MSTGFVIQIKKRLEMREWHCKIWKTYTGSQKSW